MSRLQSSKTVVGGAISCNNGYQQKTDQSEEHVADIAERELSPSGRI
jgi:hypothetical protein